MFRRAIESAAKVVRVASAGASHAAPGTARALKPLQNFRAFSEIYNAGKTLTEICPWYEVPKYLAGKEFLDFNTYRTTLGFKLGPLIDGDDFHQGAKNLEEGLEGRAKVIAAYHQAMLEAEEQFVLQKIDPYKTVLQDRLELTCIDTQNEKAKGCLVLASVGRVVVGRMFIADVIDDKHLTAFSTHNTAVLTKNEIDYVDVGEEMLRAYFEHRLPLDPNLLTSRIRKSCIGYYDSPFVKIAQKNNLLPPDNNSGHPLSDMIKYHPRDEDDVEDGMHIGDPETAGLEMTFSMKSLALLAGLERGAAKQDELTTDKVVALSQVSLQKLASASLTKQKTL